MTVELHSNELERKIVLGGYVSWFEVFYDVMAMIMLISGVIALVYARYDLATIGILVAIFAQVKVNGYRIDAK